MNSYSLKDDFLIFIAILFFGFMIISGIVSANFQLSQCSPERVSEMKDMIKKYPTLRLTYERYSEDGVFLNREYDEFVARYQELETRELLKLEE